MKLTQKLTIDKLDTIRLEKLLKDTKFKATWVGPNLVNCALVPCGFDIETTRQFMYIWTFSIKNLTIIGYTWDDYKKLLDMLQQVLKLGKHITEVHHRKDNKDGKWKAGDVTEEISAPFILPIFIHNLVFEYSFMKSEFSYENVFCLDKDNRNPLYLLDEHFLYIDSHKVVPKKLADVAKAYCTTQKAVGDLDYTIDRNTDDAKNLSNEELKYCVCDTRILVELAEFIFNNYFIPYGRLPLTQNQIVKAAIHKKHLDMDKDEKEKLDKVVKDQTISQLVYKLVRRDGFRGGFCGSSGRDVIADIIYGDEASAYFSAIMHGYYPCTRYTDITDRVHTEKEINRHCKVKCCQMRLKIYNLRCKTKFIKYESLKKVVRFLEDGTRPLTRKEKRDCIKVNKQQKIVSAQCIGVSLNEIDWELYKKLYTWDKVEVIHFETAVRGELPKYVIDAAIEFYTKKATLKKAGIRDARYESAKVLVSNIFGAMVQKVSDELVDGDKDTWLAEMLDEELKPQWGCYVSSHARKVLIDLILALGPNTWLYSDTDSVYFIKTDKTMEILEKYNIEQKAKNKAMCEKYSLDYNIFDDLGCFDGDSKHIVHFKTLGPKSYLYMEADGSYHFVMSGIPEEYFWAAYDAKYDERTEEQVFEFFEANTEITYIRKKLKFVDEETTEVINSMTMTSKSGAIIVEEKIVGELCTVVEKIAAESAIREMEDRRT